MTTTTKAYWLNGTAYCADCVECETPCLGEEEIARATTGDGVGRCGCCGKMFDDGESATTTKTYRVRLLHNASIPGARWCEPIGWEPTHEVEGAEFVDGGWWSDDEEEAGLVWFGERDAYGHQEIIEASLDDLRVASCGEVRILGEVKVADEAVIDQARPVLYRYDDSTAIRNATADELAASKTAAESDGGAGVITVDGVDCYVQE